MVEIISFESIISWVNLENCCSDPSNLGCGVPQGSILGPLLFPMYANDMTQAVEANIFPCADDSCLVFQENDVIEIENQLHGDFKNIWMVSG